jgi:hypothetical protein
MTLNMIERGLSHSSKMLMIVLTLLLLSTTVSAQTGKVSIDAVTNQYSSTQLAANHVHKVSIRYNFTGCTPPEVGVPLWTGSNGFEVYSPDGADWGYLQGSDGPLVTSLSETVTRWRRHWYFNGTTWAKTASGGTTPAPGSGGSATRAGYYLATTGSDDIGGYIGGTSNGIAVILEFTTRREDMPKTICVDTNATITSWEWASSGYGSGRDFPTWNNGLGVSGPRCWEIFYMECGKNAIEAGSVTAPAKGIECNTCCKFRVGDANGSGEEMPTISDVSAMIDAKFISGSCDGILNCLYEADINRSGGTSPDCNDITVGDISTLIDYLFITGPTHGTLPECL